MVSNLLRQQADQVLYLIGLLAKLLLFFVNACLLCLEELIGLLGILQECLLRVDILHEHCLHL